MYDRIYAVFLGKLLEILDLLFYNENNPRFTYKPKRFTRRNGLFSTILYMDFRNIMYQGRNI
jgi:hypothetical protein